MAASFVSASTAVATGVTSLVVPAPASIVAGNLLVTVLAESAGTGHPTSTGWTWVSSDPTYGAMSVFWKTAGGSEPGTYTFGPWSGSAGLVSAVMLQYASAAGLDGAPTYGHTASASTATVPSITPTTTTDIWLAAVWVLQTATASPPSGFTGRADSGFGSTANRMAGFDQPLASSSPTGTATSALGATVETVTASVLILPAGPGTITGTAILTLGPLSLTATGTNIPVVSGTATVALGPLTVTALGVPIVVARLTLGPLALTALSTVSGVSGTPTIVTVADMPLTFPSVADGPLTSVTLGDVP